MSTVIAQCFIVNFHLQGIEIESQAIFPENEIRQQNEKYFEKNQIEILVFNNQLVPDTDEKVIGKNIQNFSF